MKRPRSNSSNEIWWRTVIGDEKKNKCNFTAWYFYDRAFIKSEDIRKLAEQVFIHSGFDTTDKLDIEGFSILVKKNHELSHYIKAATRNEIWSEQYRHISETSSEGSNIETKNTAPESHYSKTSVLDIAKIGVLDPENKSTLNPVDPLAKSSSLPNEEVKDEKVAKSYLEVYNSSKLAHITEEADTGPIDLYTTKIAAVKKGFLMKLRSHCGDFIKRFYFLKNNILYFYG